jgi:hypothetical protein
VLGMGFGFVLGLGFVFGLQRLLRFREAG